MKSTKDIFSCPFCKGKGGMEVHEGYGNTVWSPCRRCDGTGIESIKEDSMEEVQHYET